MKSAGRPAANRPSTGSTTRDVRRSAVILSPIAREIVLERLLELLGFFRALVGKRTWRGLIGVLGFPPLMDGGNVTAPNVRIFSPTGDWIAENTGVAPDVEVELDAKAVVGGRDPQLERAVAIAMEQLQKNPPPAPHRPAYPDYQRAPGGNGSKTGTR